MYRVPPAALEGLRRRIAALDLRAGRLGGEPIGVHDTGRRDDQGNALVVLHGRAPVLAGWSLAAIIEHHESGCAVRAVSDAGERLAPERFARPWCEHCRLRRRRRTTFAVVHGASGETRQVGSGCLREFLGGVDPERACRQAERLALARDQLARAEHATPPAVPLAEFAAHAAHVVRAHGWVSRNRARSAGRPASADQALRSLHITPGAPGAADRELADSALRWARALLAAKRDPSPFEREATAVATAGRSLGRREQGLVCALIAAYRQRRARSRHLAHPGADVRVTVLVERVRAQDSPAHGTVRRCELTDADANRLVWWQTQGPPLRPGETVALAARVQRHTRFGDSAVTVLSHCRRAASPRPSGGFATAPGT